MKKRNGFVSNSSTCSFTCEACGDTESGWDSLGPEDYGFRYCINEHEICFECLLDVPEYTEPEEDDFETEEEWEVAHNKWEQETDYGQYSVPEEGCPVCTMSVISDFDLKRYLKKLFNVPKDEAFAHVKALNKRRKKLYTSEYNAYVMTKKALNPLHVADEIRANFKTYREFREFLRG